MRLALASLVGLCLAAFSMVAPCSMAHADVVDQPPMSCPAGSTPSTSHSGPYCRASEECVAGGVCPGGGGCVTVRQCIETRDCGGMTRPDAARCTLEHVVGPCADDGSCSAGVCRDRSVCPGPSTSSSGCSCRATSRPWTNTTLATLGLLGAVAVSRRARRLRLR